MTDFRALTERVSLATGAVQNPLNPCGEGFLGLGRSPLVPALTVLTDTNCQVQTLPVLDGWPTPWSLIHRAALCTNK